MQTITTGHSMELILLITIILLLTLCFGLILCTMGKFNQLESTLDNRARKNAQVMDNVFEDLGDIHQMTADILEKINSLPDLIREDNYRSMEALKGNIEPTMPKTNNWDSVRKAFKGPSRIEVNE